MFGSSVEGCRISAVLSRESGGWVFGVNSALSPKPSARRGFLLANVERVQNITGPTVNIKLDHVWYPSLLSCPEAPSDIYETVKVSLILVAPFLFQALMLLERLMMRGVVLFVGRR
jgi:hypothetical protein